MFLQLDPNAVDNPGKCLFPLEKAQELHLQALGLLVKWFFTKGRAALLLKSLNSGFGVDINDVSCFGGVFSVGAKVHQEFGVVSSGLAPNLDEFVMELLGFN